jgi:hypothetical protein
MKKPPCGAFLFSAGKVGLRTQSGGFDETAGQPFCTAEGRPKGEAH